MSKQNKRIIIIFVLIFLNICFIFSQSLLDADASNSLSGGFEDFFEGLIFKLFNLCMDLCYFVRKFAHFFEFFVLGTLVFLNCRIIKNVYGKSFFGYGLFSVLGVAVTDEFIQNFTGRTSQVKDVLIDFSGAIFGLLVVVLFGIISKKTKMWRENNVKRKKQ